MTTRALELLATAEAEAVTSGLRPPQKPKVDRAPGDALTDTIKLTRFLDEGGMGSVWEAEWHDPDAAPIDGGAKVATPVAVKLLRHTIADNSIARERFRREAEAAMRIESPHVVRVLTHGRSSSDEQFIVMEVLDGETLGDRIEREGRISLEAALAVVWQAGRAIAAAHALGIVHRDIKPDNLFLVRTECDPFVKVLDFGIAKDTGAIDPSVTSTGAVVGTPAFMAPEQMVGAPVGPAVDVWSLGVVAYLAVTGKLPFEGTSLASIAVAIERGDVSLPSTLRDGLPTWFDTWLMRALAPNPADRYLDVAEMLDALARAENGASIVPPPPRRSAPDEAEVGAPMLIPGVGPTSMGRPNPARDPARASTLSPLDHLPPIPRRARSSWMLAVVAAVPLFALASLVTRSASGVADVGAAQSQIAAVATRVGARASAVIRNEGVTGVAQAAPAVRGASKAQAASANGAPARDASTFAASGGGAAAGAAPAANGAPSSRPRRNLGF